MHHEMSLRPGPFEMISQGHKTYELRLYDEKRKTIRPGDKIVFTNTKTGERLKTRVIGLHRFDSFAQLYEHLPLERCGYKTEELAMATAADMLAYYPEEKQKMYGVLAIEIVVISQKGE